jgi:hypothetical protein
MVDGYGMAGQADVGASFVTENIKKIVGGWLCWLMRASLRCARACGARNDPYFVLYGTAKAVP